MIIKKKFCENISIGKKDFSLIIKLIKEDEGG